MKWWTDVGKHFWPNTIDLPAKKQNPLIINENQRVFGAQDWIRTSTSLRTLRPEHSASTNFATWAFLVQGCKYNGKPAYVQNSI